MIPEKHIELVYFIGIGGIGMSALARYYNRAGKIVMGYDKTPSPLTTELEMEGIAVHFSDTVHDLPTLVRTLSKEAILVVYTPAIPSSHNELNWFISNGYRVLKRSEVLGNITRESSSIAIAGTHGKTTTSSLTAHIMHASGKGCNAFLGGIAVNYRSNFLYHNEDAWSVVEADEYDRSFLQLQPEIAVITSIDADHLDIYGNAESVAEGYKLFSERVKRDGKLLLNDRIPSDGFGSHYTYGTGAASDFRAENIKYNGGLTTFDYVHPKGRINELVLPMPGEHNLNNAIAAISASLIADAPTDHLHEILRSFKGIQRRFEYKIDSEDCVYIDDYAHHPAELRATISAVRASYPGKIITGIFQPHLFTRTRDFADEFAQSLDLLDVVYLLEIYPAREEPIPGIDSQWLLDKLQNTHKKLVAKTQLLADLKANRPEVLLTLGAGDIDRLVEPIEQLLKKRSED